MKLQHLRLRTSLSLTKIHKLCSIHVNRRVLNNSKWKYTKKLYELSEEEELMLENTLLEMEISMALQPQPDVVELEDSGDSERALRVQEVLSTPEGASRMDRWLTESGYFSTVCPPHPPRDTTGD